MGQSTVWSRWIALGFVAAVGLAVVPIRAGAQWHAEVLPGVRFGAPLRAGFALGVTYGTQVSFAQFAGPIAIAEAGLGGGRVSGGYLLAFPFASGIEVLASAVRTWGSPLKADGKETLAGGELRGSFFSVNVGVGIFRPVVSGNDRRTRIYMNVGFGI
ncbi:MAG TPA: hypothetical protein VFZ21_18385 [Gemmatimonadaceae bacterium]|jgi:hypothetical protein|nr:hypothetical protein [Gemmatimonadaceae bacterium]